MNVREDNIFIAPDSKDAPRIARMLKYQGDMRGFIMPDDTLLIFDSYGNTHSSIVTYFTNGAKRYLDMGTTLIFRLDGGVLVDAICGKDLESAFNKKDAQLIRLIYKHLDPTISPYMTQD